jgi:two-component system, OmpR family, alkaline phosphatase synthesis response regulator PhoP
MQATKAILIVEDEENLHEALKLNLELEGYEVTSAYDGATALEKAKAEFFNLVILDVMLPEIDGIAVLETLRIKTPDLPVLILSAKNTSADKILGLKKGADDYLTKPFNLEELLLRVEKLIQKSQQLQNKNNSTAPIVAIGNCTVNFKSLECTTVSNQSITLTKKEAQLLQLLIDNKNEVVTREKILNTVWGYNVYPTTRTVDNFILNFRKYFEANTKQPQYFHSIRGVGYKFTP